MTIDKLIAVCETCLYSDQSASPVDRADGEWILCVRRPPVVLRAADDGYSGGDGVHPRVDRYAVCGEWVLDLSSDAASGATLSHAITLPQYNQLHYSFVPRIERNDHDA